MKLELKHLACYLPYGLKCQYSDGKIVEIDPVSTETDYDNNKTPLFHCFGEHSCKPILRPLSDLWEEVDEEWRYFDLMKAESDGSNHCEEWLDHLVDFYDKLEEVDFTQSPYSFLLIMFKCHFDVFGLIDKGLAINVNTLE